MCEIFFFFFFQAEDGIRDVAVTGVQTVCSSDLLWHRLSPVGRLYRQPPSDVPQTLVCGSPFILDEVTMRQPVTSQELMESFTIVPSERELLGTKSGASRLGCAVLLKYFQFEGRFPTTWDDVPREVIRHLAQSFGVSPDAYRQYDLDERLARDHKDQIRQWTGFRQGNTVDAEAMKAWSCAQSRVDETTIPVLTDRLTQRYKQLQIELPTPGRLERLAHSAAQTMEEQFFARLTEALALDTRQMIDAMLTDSLPHLSLSTLKTDSGRRSLDSLEAEVEKLHQ